VNSKKVEHPGALSFGSSTDLIFLGSVASHSLHAKNLALLKTTYRQALVRKVVKVADGVYLGHTVSISDGKLMSCNKWKLRALQYVHFFLLRNNISKITTGNYPYAMHIGPLDLLTQGNHTTQRLKAA